MRRNDRSNASISLWLGVHADGNEAEILIVDDELFLLLEMREALEAEGYIVHEATTRLEPSRCSSAIPT